MIIVTGGFSKKSFLLFSEAAVRRCSSKQVLLEILQYSQENISVAVFFNKVAGLMALWPATLFQPHPKTDFNTSYSCENCEIFTNSFFMEHLWWLVLFV